MSVAARRAAGSVVGGCRVESRGGRRLGRQAWQDIRRACQLAGVSERVRAVDIHGVHISFSTSSPSCHNGIGAPAPRVQPAPSTNSSTAQERAPRPPNSRQRRSAKRLENFLCAKKASAAAAGSPAAAAHRVEGLGDTKASLASDDSMDVERPASPRREQQRILEEASEALAERSQAAAPHGPAGGEPRHIRMFRRPR